MPLSFYLCLPPSARSRFGFQPSGANYRAVYPVVIHDGDWQAGDPVSVSIESSVPGFSYATNGFFAGPDARSRAQVSDGRHASAQARTPKSRSQAPWNHRSLPPGHQMEGLQRGLPRDRPLGVERPWLPRIAFRSLLDPLLILCVVPSEVQPRGLEPQDGGVVVLEGVGGLEPAAKRFEVASDEEPPEVPEPRHRGDERIGVRTAPRASKAPKPPRRGTRRGRLQTFSAIACPAVRALARSSSQCSARQATCASGWRPSIA